MDASYISQLFCCCCCWSRWVYWLCSLKEEEENRPNKMALRKWDTLLKIKVWMEKVQYVHNGYVTKPLQRQLSYLWNLWKMFCDLHDGQQHIFLYCLQWNTLYIYSSQHWIKKVQQSCPKTRTHFGFRTTMMKAFDLLQMLTSLYIYIYIYIYFFVIS